MGGDEITGCSFEGERLQLTSAFVAKDSGHEALRPPSIE
jgi:hypothetical protein